MNSEIVTAAMDTFVPGKSVSRSIFQTPPKKVSATSTTLFTRYASFWVFVSALSKRDDDINELVNEVEDDADELNEHNEHSHADDGVDRDAEAKGKPIEH